MDNLPLLPGYTFHDVSLQDYKLSHKLDILNGFPVIRDTKYGIGRRPVDTASTAYVEDTDSVEYDPSLTYGRTCHYAYQQFVPHYVLFAQKCLCFKAFFRQGVFNSPNEHYRVRHVNIIYFLEDDTLCVMEPVIDNAGIPQGKLVRRERIQKNKGDFFIWKDFNVGINVCIHGVVYHIVDCDPFTREFLMSQGIDVGDKENPPVDPYMKLRVSKFSRDQHINVIDTRRQFLEYDKMVLLFDATWNDDHYQIMYFLDDNTISIREIHQPNDGKDPVAMLLKRTRIPKDWKNLPSTFPSIYMEYGDPEIVQYYTPRDFRLGETIFIFGRRFLLHDCDAFTRKYYSDMLGISQPSAIAFPTKGGTSAPKQEIPPHIQFGSPEDTYASCLSFILKPPKKNVIRQLTNLSKKLRYSAQMEAVRTEDENRDFIFEYRLSDGTILINEIEKRNSGRKEGCFLSSRLIPKPGTGRDDPLYYTPEDFFIGAKIDVFNHHFIITGADLFVYRYIEANRDKFCQEVRENIRNYFMQRGMIQDDVDVEAEKIQEALDERRIFEDNTTVINKDDLNVDKCTGEFNGMNTKN